MKWIFLAALLAGCTAESKKPTRVTYDVVTVTLLNGDVKQWKGEQPSVGHAFWLKENGGMFIIYRGYDEYAVFAAPREQIRSMMMTEEIK